MLAAGSGSPLAIGLVFLAGTITSVGPCVAPRYVAIAAIVNGYRRPIVPTAAFIAGLVCAFVALGFGAGLLGSTAASSTIIYGSLALGLLCGGLVTLVRAAAPQTRAECCTADRHHAPASSPRDSRTLGGVFLLGAASAFVVSPCCTPVVATIVATSAAIGKPGFGMILLVSFALGHALPLFFAGSIGSIVQRLMRGRVPAQASAIVAGTLMLALAAYYGILA